MKRVKFIPMGRKGRSTTNAIAEKIELREARGGGCDGVSHNIVISSGFWSHMKLRVEGRL
jgi:hypothetical protein